MYFDIVQHLLEKGAVFGFGYGWNQQNYFGC
jgi:hypothetical protein